MAFCKYCGKQIPDGETCDCQSAAAQTQQPQNNDYSQTPDGGATGVNKPSNKAVIVLVGGLVLVLILIILLISLIAGSGYKKPLKNIVKGLEKGDTQKIVEAILTDDMIEDLADEEFDDEDDMYDELDDIYDEIMDALEDTYGDDIKFSFDYESKKKLSDNKLGDCEDFYDDYLDANVDIKKGYKIEGTLKIEGSDDDIELDDITLYVVNIKGDGWKLCPYGLNFGMIEDLEDEADIF